jgi:hypothetical protein
MKKSSCRIWLIVCIMFLFTAHAYAQAPSAITKIETLLKKNQADTKSVRLAGSLVIIDQKNMGAGYDFQVPYADVAYSSTYSTKSRKDTLYNVNIKCPDNKDCLTISDNDKEYRKKNIWLSFRTKSDADTFIILMKELKQGK